jgi:tight adherence protein B
MKPRLFRCGAVSVVLAALPLLAPTPAFAATGNMSDVEVVGRNVQFVFDAEGAEIDPKSVQVTVDGTVIKDTTAEAIGTEAIVTRKAMLVVDTSGSMNQNGRLDGARQAAKTFLDAAPPDLLVGLITFDSNAQVVTNPTTDRAALSRALDGLTAKGTTAIYDAVVLAAKTLGEDGSRSIVLLTDGRPSGGQAATAADATGALRNSKIRLDAVAFQTKEDAPLRRLATAGGGDVVSSDSSADLTATFKAAGQRLSNQLLVSANVPIDGPTGQVTLAVSGTADGAPVSDSAIALIDISATKSPKPIDSAPKPTQLASGPFMNNGLIWLAAGIFFLGMLGVLAFAFDGVVPTRKPTVTRQLAVYSIHKDKAKQQKRESTAFGSNPVAQTAVEFAGKLAAQRGFEEWLQRKLDAAGMKLRPAEWILLQAIIVLLLPLFAFVVSGRSLVLTVVAVVVAFIRGFVMLSIRESRRRKKFENGLADTLQLMAGSLSAGYSLPQAADSVVKEGEDPISTEFNKALVETRLGVPIEDAFEAVADRMRSKDWGWVVMAIRIQREVGGNLAELLVTVASTLRERARLRRQVQTLSAEGRLSAWILGGLPIVFTLYLLVARPSYILTLTHELLGWIMIVSGVIIMTIGALWMKKIVDVEV